ncbi:MAG: hypothetical protein NTV49_12865 [Kiritimatiellaeota bacterium]|nr:hypothetical protein [Kiritimatiellota bacterium]
MNEIRIMGAIFFAGGILMAVFHRAVGIGFCRMGKTIWSRTSPFAKSLAPDMIKLYDEAKAPRTMLILGIVFAAEGVVFWVLSEWIG